MLLAEFDYNLPNELIAQMPSEKREQSKMMVLDKNLKTIEHKHFYDFTDYLCKDDVLVLNDTRVIPARIFAQKDNGVRIEVFLLKKIEKNTWFCLIKPAKRVKVGMTLSVQVASTTVGEDDLLKIELLERFEDGRWVAELKFKGDFYTMLDKVGNIPLPPYIERTLSDKQIKALDFERYQTVFAKTAGSVAAPTAGLHFTKEILEKLKSKGIKVCYVTLNVGLGTFKPVKCDDISAHKMDSETFEISQETANIINQAKADGKNVIAVGTTSVRTLETAFEKYGQIQACKDFSEKFIYPPYQFKVVDKLLTNFHLPKSTLIMLVSAMAGKDFVFEAYSQAIENKYRFYSYGDCMFIQ